MCILVYLHGTLIVLALQTLELKVLNSKQRHLLKRFFWELVAVFEGAVYLLHVHTISAF